MFTVQPITDFDDPRLAPFRTLKKQFDHWNEGFFVAEGEKVVRRLLESPHEIVSVLLPPKWFPDYEPLLVRRPETISVFVAEKEVLENLTGFSMFQGLLGLARVPRPAMVEDLLVLPRPHLFAAVDGLSNAENVGAVVRNATALGVQAILLGETSAPAYLRRAVRSSMGTIFRLPYLGCRVRHEGRPMPGEALTDTLRRLRDRGIRCVAAHPHTDRRTLWQADLTRDTCIVLGAEGDGIRPEVLAECDEVVAIPMAAGVDSLNVACAAAVFFGEAQRQRGAGAPGGRTGAALVAPMA